MTVKERRERKVWRLVFFMRYDGEKLRLLPLAYHFVANNFVGIGDHELLVINRDIISWFYVVAVYCLTPL